MRRATSLIFALGLLSGSVLAQASLEIPVKTFDFGYVPQQSTISTDFWLKSNGSEDLRILKVIPGCGCTRAPLEKNVLAPGDSTRLEVIFSSKRFTNRVNKHPRIQTNAGDQVVEFLSTVVRRPDSTYPLVIKPFKFDMTPTPGSIRNEIRFSLENVSEQELTLLLVASRKSLFTVELPNKIPGGGKVEAVLRLTPDGAAQNFEKSFTIEVDDATTSRFTIPVKRSEKESSDLSAAPPGEAGK